MLNQEPYRNAEIIIAHENFGCGSSREHAPWALLDFGIRCIIAPDFADIFFNNSFKNGILPIRLPRAICDALIEDAKLGGNARITVDLERQVVVRPSGEEIHFDIDPFRKHLLLNGLDDIGQTLQHAPSNRHVRSDAAPAAVVAAVHRSLIGDIHGRQQEAADPARRRHRSGGDARSASRHRLDGPSPHGLVRDLGRSGGRRRDRCTRHADHRRDDAEGARSRCHPVRLGWRPEVGETRFPAASGAGDPAAAQGTRPVRQSAAGDRARSAGRRIDAEARRGARPRHHDRARKHRRDLFRRTARRSKPCRPARSAASIPKPIPQAKSSASPAWRSSWPASARSR